VRNGLGPVEVGFIFETLGTLRVSWGVTSEGLGDV